MSGPVRDEAKQRAWLDASELAQKIFRGHYSRAESMVLTSELFEHAYAAGHDAFAADLAAMTAERDDALARAEAAEPDALRWRECVGHRGQK